MMRLFLATLLLAILLPVHAGELWANLWRNADQQGEALMQQGDAANAAKVYADPRRKAYAKMKAGDYQGAAKDLGELHDRDADYNRGNALAHAGDLQGAVEAYDAALKFDPNNQDAKHNRELVAKVLKQQAPQQQQSGDRQSRNDKNEQDKKAGEQGKGQDESGQGNPQDQRKQQDNASQNGQNGQGKTGQQGQSNNKKIDNNQIDSKNSASGQDKGGEPSRDGEKQQDGQSGQDKNSRQAAAKNDAEQARRDAEASLAKAEADGKQGEAAGDEVNTRQTGQARQPMSEKQIAQEQWLRSIPDDPGGLLRRKFLIEHMMRQQKAQ